MATRDSGAGRPIGYWVKLLDRLINESFDQALGDEGVTRRHWQVLNVLRSGPSTQEAVDQAVAPFLEGTGETTQPILDDLAQRGWVARAEDGCSLTDAGRSALESLGASVPANRAKVAEGIDADAYNTTIETLMRMCRNLGSEEAGLA